MDADRRQLGLTLIEILVAITVLGMVAVTVGTAMSQTNRTREVLEQTQGRLHGVRVAFDLLSRDLQSAFLSMHRSTSEPTHDTIFLGRDEGGGDRLDFASFTHQRRYRGATESDQCEVGWSVGADRERSGVLNLVRRSSPVLDLEPLEGGQQLVVLQDVVTFDLQYFDLAMNEWQDTWDTTQITGDGAMLPLQVRVTLGVRDRHGEEILYATQIGIPMRTPIWRKPFLPGQPVMVTP